MTTPPDQLLADAHVDSAVHALHPDYVAVLIAATGLVPGAGTESSEGLLREAEAHAQQRLAGREPHDLPEIQAWREAFAGFGVKPREARSSAEALMRRAAAGLPRIDRLTDVYNAVSVMHAIPIGGEDLDHYEGPARLLLASGGEPFHTSANGEPVVDHPDAGEPVWVDDLGVTCRRWNWRQTSRTAISPVTTRAAFIIDSLDAPGHEGAARAAAMLAELIPGLESRVVG